jgi:hypothetical protein
LVVIAKALPNTPMQHRLNDLLSSLSQYTRAVVARQSFENIDRHVVAATIMIVIAVFGALTALRAGLAEQRSIALERRLAHAQLQDISLRQEYLAEVLVGIGIDDVRAALKDQADALRRAYNALATGNDTAATWLDWHTVELLAQRHAHRLFVLDLEKLSPGKEKSVEQDLANHSAAALRQQGYHAVVSEDINAQIALSFPLLDHAIANAHEDVPKLALCVLLFVLGLVFLTLAELELGPSWLWRVFVAAGALVALGATAYVIRIDPPAAVWFALFALAFIAIIFFAARAGLFQRTSPPGHAPHPEAPEPTRLAFLHLSGHTSHDLWSKVVVLLIAVAVFMSALFGWRYSESLKHMGEFALAAQVKRVELVNQRGRLHASILGGKFNNAIELLTARVGCAFATQLALLLADGKLVMEHESAALIVRERDRRCAALRERSKDNWLLDAMDKDNLVDSALSPARRLRDETMERVDGPENRFALADGFAEVSAAWGNRAALLLAVLTAIAIVLYLFGQAYAMGDTTAGRWLVASALVLFGASTALGAYAWLAPVLSSQPNSAACLSAAKDGEKTKEGTKAHASREHILVERAAHKYDEGMAAFNRATTAPPGSSQQAEDDEKAIAAFECALAFRPNFIPALRQLAEATERVNSPQRAENYVSLSNKAGIEAVVQAHLRRLRALERSGMSRPHGLLSSYGFSATTLALTENRPDALAEARMALANLTGTASWWQKLYVDALRPELSSDEGPSESPGVWLNLGMAELASGASDDLEAVERVYDAAFAGKAIPHRQLLAATLTDFEILKAYCANLHRAAGGCDPIVAAADRIRARVAVAASRAELSRESTVRVSDFRAAATPSTVVWQARIDGFDAKRDRLAVAWFADETRVETSTPSPDLWRVRRALPTLYEIYRPGGSAKLPVPDQYGATRRIISYIEEMNACLPAGHYVAELFVNGVLVASRQTVVESDLRVYRSRELDLLWCIPTWWAPHRSKGAGDRWLADMPVRGFTVAGLEGRDPQGAIMTFYAPPGMSDDERRRYFVRRAVRILLRMTGRSDQWNPQKEESAVRRIIAIDRLSYAQCNSPGLLGSPGFRVLSRRVDQASDKNLVHIGIVSPRVRRQDACAILKSLKHYF